MSIKVYLHYDEPGSPEKTSKLSIPASWSSKTVQDVINLFAKPYNDKNPDHTIGVVHLTTKEGQKIPSDGTVVEFLGDHNDYYIKPGAFLRSSVVETTKAKDTRPRCRNYGCNKHYAEDENHDTACEHHAGPPIFHDVSKFWSCCPTKKAFDFESFQTLPTCMVSKHSSVDPSISLGASPNARNIDSEGSVKASDGPVLKSISDFNATTEGAVTAESSALKALTQRKSSRKPDGTARCQRRGCQQTFEVINNNPTACQYHKGQAIFHDAVKFWSCCTDRKCHDFDDFLAVPGCERGYHDDGEIDLN